MTPEKSFKVSAVYWEDAVGHDSLPEGGLKPVKTVTVGMIEDHNDKYITVVSEVFEDGSVRQVTSIPNGMIRKIVTLRSKLPSITKAFTDEQKASEASN